MNKILLTLSAIAVVGAAAAPAAAQGYRGNDRDYRSDSRDYRGNDRGGATTYDGRPLTATVDGLAWDIDQAARDGRISRGQARQLRAELRDVKPVAWRVQTGAARGGERQQVFQTIAHIKAVTSADQRYGRNDDRGYRR